MTSEARTSKNKRSWMWIVGMALCLCLPPSVALQSQKRSLLEQSTKVVDMEKKKWFMGDYFWLSDHKVLFSGRPYYPNDTILHTYDIHSGKETWIEAASRKLGESDVPELFMSPDGTRLLWTDFGAETVHGVRLDGSHAFTCVPRKSDDGSSVQVRWASDSRHWVAYVGAEAMLYDDNPSHSPKKVLITASDYSDPTIPMDRISAQSLVLGDHILACRWIGYHPTVDLLDIGIGRTTGLKTRHIQLPPKAIVEAMAFAPKGDRIAWILARPDIPPSEPIQTEQVPGTSIGPFRTEALWVSNIDGTQMHEIGSRNLKAEENFQPQIIDLQWVPGNIRLSFMCFDKGWGLYTVSAK
jgi:hypothetical protein